MRHLPAPTELEAPVLLVEQHLSDLHQALQADDARARWHICGKPPNVAPCPLRCATVSL